MKRRLWIVPNNDLEARTIIEMLKKKGEEYLVTEQAWGASWEGLETEIKEKLSNRKIKVTVNEPVPEDEYTMKTKGKWGMGGAIPWSTNPPGSFGKEYVTLERYGTREMYLMAPQEEEYTLPSEGHKRGGTGILSKSLFHAYRKVTHEELDTNVYGIELQGESPYHNIDHHIYGEDDRSNEKSSIEQVAEILGVKLSLDQLFVSANDKGYIPAMEELGRALWLTEKELNEVITNIRMREREIQGVTIEQETQTQEAIEALGDISEKRDYIEIDLPHSKTSTVCDRLYGKYNNLLITSADGETNFFGEAYIINMLQEKFPNPNPEEEPYCRWASGDYENSGYGFWGGNKYLNQEAVKIEVQNIINKNREMSKAHEDISLGDK